MSRIHLATCLASTLGFGATVLAAPITFELNDDGINDGSVTGNGTTTVTGIGGVGADELTLTLTATATGTGVSVSSINEGGGGGQSGLGIAVTGPNTSNSPNEAQDVSSNNPPNPINETFVLSFTDENGFDVAVEFLSAEVSRLAGSGESVIVTIDSFSDTILSSGNQNAFSTSFTGSPVLAAGSQATFAPGAGTSYRIHSITVQEVESDVVIPEPASLALLSLGGLCVLGGRRRR
ncbi:MAG: PEP-CTERM sorting domain-containing protein [Planctomycetota bacterium]